MIHRKTRYGHIATFPMRELAFETVVNSIISQVDILYIYLNEYKEIPKLLQASNKQIIFKYNGEDLGASGVSVGQVSDGYHTFDELYEHRSTLYIALCKLLCKDKKVWKSKLHSDGTSYDGWLVLGINEGKGDQITYHLSNHYWKVCSFAETLDVAPEFDGHTSEDVIKRIQKNIIT